MKSFGLKITPLPLLAAAASVALVALAPVAGAQRPAPVVEAADGQTAVPIEPSGATGSVRDLLYARPFVMERPYTYDWTREREEVASGLVMAVEVDREFARPRQVDVPVLYVGGTPAQLTNIGYESAHMIVIVPGEIDLKDVPIFFGSTELPERVDRSRGRLELKAARDAGARAFAPQRVAQAFEAGGDTLRVAGIEELLLAIADLIEVYAPDETEAVELYRMMPTRR